MQIVATGLTPNTAYVLRLTGPTGQAQDLAALMTTAQGGVTAQTIGPVKQLLNAPQGAGQLSVVAKVGGATVLVQSK